MYINYRQEVVRVAESTMNENPDMGFRSKQIDAGRPESAICTNNRGYGAAGSDCLQGQCQPCGRRCYSSLGEFERTQELYP